MAASSYPSLFVHFGKSCLSRRRALALLSESSDLRLLLSGKSTKSSIGGDDKVVGDDEDFLPRLRDLLKCICFSAAFRASAYLSSIVCEDCCVALVCCGGGSGDVMIVVLQE